MILSPLAKHANNEYQYKQLQRCVEAHNKADTKAKPAKESEIDIKFNPNDLDKAIQSAIQKSLDKHFK